MLVGGGTVAHRPGATGATPQGDPGVARTRMAGAAGVPSVAPRPDALRHDPRPASRLGLPVWALLALSLLAAPRVVLHDLGLATDGPLVGLLAVGPAVVWVVAVVRARARWPLVALLVVGLGYGVVLAVGHHLFWDEVFDDLGPQLGGNLDDTLSPGAEEALMRTAMTLSSLLTGAAVGLVCGLVALGVQAVSRSLARR